MKKYSDFEDYLMEKCFNENTHILDDEQPDYFNEWLCNLEPDDFIKYGNSYAIELSIKNKLDKVYEQSIINNTKES